MGTLISLFHSKLPELQQRYPLFKIEPIREELKKGGVFHFSVALGEDFTYYFNNEPKYISRLDHFHFLAGKIKEFNETFTNLKVYIEDPNVVWISNGDDRTPIFADFADFGSKEGKQEFEELNKKAAYLSHISGWFICSHCHSIKKDSFLFTKVIAGKTCVSCVEVALDGTDY